MPWLVVASFVAVWELLSRAGVISALFFPSPTTILNSLGHLFAAKGMLSHLGVTLSRVGLGFVLGAPAGLTLGLAMGWSPRLRAVLDPFVAAGHPIPKIAVLPLVMIIFGIGEVSIVILIGVAVFFPLLINAMAGVQQINPIHFEVAQNYGATRFRLLTRVILPGSLPLILAGTRLALNIALLLAIAVELVAANDGLGKVIWLAWQTLRTEELYASLIVIAAIGMGLNAGLQMLRAYLTPWHRERQI